MTIETSRWDVQDYLSTPERMAAYLSAAFQEGDLALIRTALGDVAKAKGMTALARETGLTREALYRVVGDDGNPTLETLTRIIKAFGLRLEVAV